MHARLVTVLFSLLLATSLALSGGDPVNNISNPPKAEFLESEGHVLLIWYSADESGVSYYEISRRNGGQGNPSIQIGREENLKGNGQRYEFVDATALKTLNTFYVYDIYAVYGNGSKVGPYQATVVVAYTSVRKTWGSIKAMFR